MHVQDQTIGKVHFVRFTISAHLADWHPWEPYQEFYMSKGDLGGGALLDDGHWIDQMIWMFSPPDQVIALVDKVSSLEITSDDSVDLLARYRNGLAISMHLDIFGRPHERSIKAIGENGTLKWEDMTRGSVLKTYLADQQETIFDNERNDMFVEVAKEFLDVVEEVKTPSCSLEDGIEVMRVIDAARISAGRSRFVSLSEIS